MPALAHPPPLTRLAPEEQQVLTDWVAFIKSGFELAHFTEPLYHHLAHHAILETHGGREAFWHTYFNRRALEFLALLNQFGGDLSAAVGNFVSLPPVPWWGFPDDEQITNLNLAMIKTMEQVYNILLWHLDGMLATVYEARKLEILAEEYNHRMQEGELAAGMSLEDFLSLENETYEYQVYYDAAIEDIRIRPDMRRSLARAISENGWRGPRIAALRTNPNQRAAPQQDLFTLYHWRKRGQQGAQPDQAAGVGQSDAFSQQGAAHRQRLVSVQRRADSLARRRRLTTEPAARAKPQPVQEPVTSTSSVQALSLSKEQEPAGKERYASLSQ